MNLSRSIVCSVCKRKRIIASGFNAQAMDRVKIAPVRNRLELAGRANTEMSRLQG